MTDDTITKAERIIMLRQAYPEWTVKEIALAVSGKTTLAARAYVRVVLNQRKGTKPSSYDRKYRKTPKFREANLRKHKRCQKKELAYEKVLRGTGDKDAANLAGRLAYAEARSKGMDRMDGERARGRARERVLRDTGNRKLAWVAYSEAPMVELTKPDPLPNPNESCQL